MPTGLRRIRLAATKSLIEAYKAEDKQAIKGASAKLEKIRKAIAAAEGVS